MLSCLQDGVIRHVMGGVTCEQCHETWGDMYTMPRDMGCHVYNATRHGVSCIQCHETWGDMCTMPRDMGCHVYNVTRHGVSCMQCRKIWGDNGWPVHDVTRHEITCIQCHEAHGWHVYNVTRQCIRYIRRHGTVNDLYTCHETRGDMYTMSRDKGWSLYLYIVHFSGQEVTCTECLKMSQVHSTRHTCNTRLSGYCKQCADMYNMALVVQVVCDIYIMVYKLYAAYRMVYNKIRVVHSLCSVHHT